MSDYKKLAKDLMTSLELSLQPIAVSFCEVASANVPSFAGVVPAGCVFWQEAATGTFVTSGKDHELLRDRGTYAPYLRSLRLAAGGAARGPHGDERA